MCTYVFICTYNTHAFYRKIWRVHCVKMSFLSCCYSMDNTEQSEFDLQWYNISCIHTYLLVRTEKAINFQYALRYLFMEKITSIFKCIKENIT